MFDNFKASRAVLILVTPERSYRTALLPRDRELYQRSLRALGRCRRILDTISL